MSPRYAINPRPIYDPNEPTWQEGLGRGISSAITEYERKREVGRTEQNQLGAMGATPVAPPPEPSPMQRLRGIGRGIADLIHGRRPSFTDAAGPTFAGPQITGAQRDGMPAGTIGSTMATPLDAGDRVAGVPPRTPGSPGYPNPERGAERMTLPPPSVPPRYQRGIAPALDQTIRPYDYEDVRGRHYSVDPLYGARVQAAASTMGRNAREEEQIAALVQAGMAPDEARARVLNNVVRYDETFGQQPRSTGGLTFEQRHQLQNEQNQVRLAVARMGAAGRQNSTEYRQQLLRLREIDQQLRAAGMEASGLQSEAAGVERTIPSGTNRIVEESQPGGRQRIQSAADRAAELRRRASDVRGRAAAAVTDRAAGAKRTITQAQYDAAIAKGHSDADIARSYTIPTTVKRKR